MSSYESPKLQQGSRNPIRKSKHRHSILTSTTSLIFSLFLCCATYSMKADGSRIVDLCSIIVESGSKVIPVRDQTESSCIDFHFVDRKHHGRFKSKSLSDWS